MSTPATDPCTDAASALPRISVIIPHLNAPALLDLCLASVAGQELDHGAFEIIVVDNGSDQSPALAAAPAARLLHEATAGPGPARNTGIAAARAPLVACIDADCIAQRGWLQAAVDALEEDPDHPAGGEITIAPANPSRLTGIEAYESVFGFRQRLYIKTKRFSVTANLAMTRALHQKIGPFAGIDTAEDLDWGRRAYAMGHPTRYVPAMHITHPARSDIAALQRKWQRHIRHDHHALPSQNVQFEWYLKSLALILSIPLEAFKLLVSPRLAGLGNRARGIAVLVRIRVFRAAEMVRVTKGPPQNAQDVWNRI